MTVRPKKNIDIPKPIYATIGNASIDIDGTGELELGNGGV